MGGLGSFLCSPNAHARPIVFLDRRCSSKRAVGSHLAHPEEGRTSKLGRMIGTDLRTGVSPSPPGEKGTSRVSDCKAIGGSVGEKARPEWAGENADRSSGAVHFSQVAVTPPSSRWEKETERAHVWD